MPIASQTQQEAIGPAGLLVTNSGDAGLGSSDLGQDAAADFAGCADQRCSLAAVRSC